MAGNHALDLGNRLARGQHDFQPQRAGHGHQRRQARVSATGFRAQIRFAGDAGHLGDVFLFELARLAQTV